MFAWLHNFQPQPILFQLGWLKIHWYGFLIACGAVLAFSLVLFLAKKYQLNKDHIFNLGFYVIIFGLIGDRLYYVFYAWKYYSHNLLDIFKIWQGGLAIHGAMIAGVLVILIYAKKNKLNPWFLTDLAVVALPLAMAIGRWGNFFNMELFGRPTNLPWGIFISEAKRPLEFISSTHFHPTFLYESFGNLIILIILLGFHFFRLKKYKNNLKNISGLGNITLIYLILYSILRFSNEFLRQDYSPYFLGLRWAQVISLLIIGSCLIIFIYKLVSRKKSP